MTQLANDFMMDAIKCAIRAAEHNDVPIGAVIVRDGKIIARGENRVQKDMDPTGHAELVAIRAATKKLGKKFLDGCDIYVTLEPCAMCATAISFARMRSLIFAAIDIKGGAVFSGVKIFENSNHLWKPEIGINSDYSVTSGEMLKKFFRRLRAAKNPEKYGIPRPLIAPAERAKKIAKTKKFASAQQIALSDVGMTRVSGKVMPIAWVSRRAGVMVRAKQIAKTKQTIPAKITKDKK